MNEVNKQKSMAWYFHPNEMVRIMRTRLLDSIDPLIDTTPNYNKNNLNVGVVIGTYGATPYVEMQLYFLQKINGIKNILIHDDCSPEKEQLKELAKKYNVNFISTEKNLFHRSCIGSIGDQNCFYRGLEWAKSKNIDVLVKFSRRLIACYRWIDDFKKLVLESDGITFSSFCKKDKFPIRTECIGLNVNAWTNSFTTNMFKFTIENEFCTFAEFWMDSMAKQLDGQNFSKKYKNWKNTHYTAQLYSGYVRWDDLLGTNRYTNEDRHIDVLWHMYSSKDDYANMLKKILPNKYENIEDVVEI